MWQIPKKHWSRLTPIHDKVSSMDFSCLSSSQYCCAWSAGVSSTHGGVTNLILMKVRSSCSRMMIVCSYNKIRLSWRRTQITHNISETRYDWSTARRCGVWYSWRSAWAATPRDCSNWPWCRNVTMWSKSSKVWVASCSCGSYLATLFYSHSTLFPKTSIHDSSCFKITGFWASSTMI